MTEPRGAIAAAMASLIRNEMPSFINDELSKRPKKRRPSGKDRSKIKAARKQRVRNRKK